MMDKDGLYRRGARAAPNHKAIIAPQAMTILHHIAATQKGFGLTAASIAAHLNLSTNAVCRALLMLEKQGLVASSVFWPYTTKPLRYRCTSYPHAKQRYLAQQEARFDYWFAEIMQNSYSNRLYRHGNKSMFGKP